MRTIWITCIAVCGLACRLPGAEPRTVPDTRVFGSVLKEFVLDDGTVKYAELKAAIAPLERFVDQIAAVSPSSNPELFPSRAHELAYWLNAYNALILWSFSKDYPASKTRLATSSGRNRFFFQTKFTVGGERRSLDDIEKVTIRRRFRDPRIHFAIVCASASCPWLSRSVYAPEVLNAQLEKQAKHFLNQDRNVSVDFTRREIRTSMIFDWFKEDFGTTPQQVIRFISQYRERDGSQLQQGKWELRYFDYDWHLNDAAGSRSGRGA